MNTLKLYEEYINSGSNRVSSLLKNLVQSLYASFSGSNNALGEKDLQGLALIDVDQSNSNDAFEKNILMRFSDANFHYQMIFVIKLDDIKDNEPITRAYMKIKIYDAAQANMIREWQSDLTVAEATDEEINSEGRYFIKVGEINAQSQGQSQVQSQTQVQTGNLDFIEQFIIEKIGFLKEFLETETAGDDGPQLQN